MIFLYYKLKVYEYRKADELMKEKSVYIVNKINELLKAKRKWKQEFGKEPTIEELSTSLHLKKEKIEELENIIKETEPIYEERKPFSVEDLSKKEFDKLVHNAKQNAYLLSDFEKQILYDSLGLHDEKKWSIDELAQKYQKKKERIRQIQAKAIRIVRNPKKIKRIREIKKDVI